MENYDPNKCYLVVGDESYELGDPAPDTFITIKRKQLWHEILQDDEEFFKFSAKGCKGYDAVFTLNAESVSVKELRETLDSKEPCEESYFDITYAHDETTFNLN